MKDDPVIGRMKVSTLIETLPGYGKAKAEKVMKELQIAESRRLRGIGERQQVALLERLGWAVRRGNLFVISGPSGAGKGTLVARLVQAVPDAWVSVSGNHAQPPVQARSTAFIISSKPREQFQQLIDSDGLLGMGGVRIQPLRHAQGKRPGAHGGRPAGHP